MRRIVVGLARGVVVAAVAAVAGAASADSGQAAPGGCVHPRPDPAYAASVRRALAAGRDVWGDKLLRSPEGPTYAGAARHLRPLLLAAARGAGRHRYLTDSGVYYLPFGRPAGGFGTRTIALHVADGSGVLADRVNGPRLSVTVGGRERERYGACLSRLSTPRLYGGYLPILETRYADAGGVRYRQESFAARIWTTRSLVSFVRLTADTTASDDAVRVRFTPSTRHLRRVERSLVRGRHTYVYLGAGARYDGSSVTYAVPAHTRATVYLAWFVDPHRSEPFTLDGSSYRRAKRGLVDFWSSWLGAAASLHVPERRVYDAERSLLIQNSVMSWRYSVGNSYQELSAPEASDVAQVMGAYGFRNVDEAILRTWFWRDLSDSANWGIGEQLLASASYYALFRDRAYVAAHTPTLASYLERLEGEVDGNGRGLLQRERFSADIGASVFGLHAQAVAWQGLRAMASVWQRTGRADLAGRARTIAARLGHGLRRAVRDSETRLPEGSLFVPVRLLDGERPYGSLTASRAGSYWNLVMPYALASGLFAPHGRRAEGLLRYLLGHGSRFLGLVRAGGYSLYGSPRFPTSGSDQVYGLNVARFLADNDRADQLVLSLYGHLAAGMTRGTFVSGEGATIAPVPGESSYRKMFLPPNAAGNAAFLETLRLLLVHETDGPAGNPRGLELAFATPRAWLRTGRRIAVDHAPTAFGALTYSLTAHEGSVRVSLDVPDSHALRSLELRLRLPAGQRLTGVVLGGRGYRRFDPRTGTIDLSGVRGRLSLVARTARKP